MAKNPQFGYGTRVWVESEQCEGTVEKTELCGRITVLLDCGFREYYEASELVRLKVKLNLLEHENYTKR